MTLSIALAFCIFIWLRTNAFIEFLGWIFAWRNIFYIGDYMGQPQTLTDSLAYPVWLYTQHQSFATKLISCPLCLSFWTNLCFNCSLEEKLASAFVTLLSFCVMDKMYKHG